MTIAVNSRDLGFWTQIVHTVQRFEIIEGDHILVWCNHAGATEEVVDEQIDRVDQPDICYQIKYLQCDKCPAWQREGDNYWEDAPENGVHYD